MITGLSNVRVIGGPHRAVARELCGGLTEMGSREAGKRGTGELV